jgi:F0F1-type ATP synthase membrane subunit c/vacuolar-type H+-ATPase subunit K
VVVAKAVAKEAVEAVAEESNLVKKMMETMVLLFSINPRHQVE